MIPYNTHFWSGHIVGMKKRSLNIFAVQQDSRKMYRFNRTKGYYLASVCPRAAVAKDVAYLNQCVTLE